MTTKVDRHVTYWTLSTGTPAGRRTILGAAVVLAVCIGSIAGIATGSVTGTDGELARLLRFMAVVKAGMMLAATGLVAWRFGSEMSDRLATGYVLAISLMALSPGLIWNMGSLILASALFHSGLLFGLALAARDGFAARK
jgi:hypothetical protein